MNTCDVIAMRIRNLCKEREWTPNHLSYISAVPQATIKSILNGESKNPGAVTIKKLCDGFEITLQHCGAAGLQHQELNKKNPPCI